MSESLRRGVMHLKEQGSIALHDERFGFGTHLSGVEWTDRGLLAGADAGHLGPGRRNSRVPDDSPCEFQAVTPKSQ